jgi:uncharacterized protein YeaC (DUF1315 family)
MPEGAGDAKEPTTLKRLCLKCYKGNWNDGVSITPEQQEIETNIAIYWPILSNVD